MKTHGWDDVGFRLCLCQSHLDPYLLRKRDVVDKIPGRGPAYTGYPQQALIQNLDWSQNPGFSKIDVLLYMQTPIPACV